MKISSLNWPAAPPVWQMWDSLTHQFVNSSLVTQHGGTAISRDSHDVREGDEKGIKVGEDCFLNFFGTGSFVHGDCSQVFLHCIWVWEKVRNEFTKAGKTFWWKTMSMNKMREHYLTFQKLICFFSALLVQLFLIFHRCKDAYLLHLISALTFILFFMEVKWSSAMEKVRPNGILVVLGQQRHLALRTLEGSAVNQSLTGIVSGQSQWILCSQSQSFRNLSVHAGRKAFNFLDFDH